MHPTLLVTPEGAKESVRWIESYESLAEQAAEHPETRLVMVGDREADFRDLMLRAEDLGQPVDWRFGPPTTG